MIEDAEDLSVDVESFSRSFCLIEGLISIYVTFLALVDILVNKIIYNQF